MPSLGEGAFTAVDLSSVVGGATAAVKRVPASPGIYSFFRKIRLTSVGDSADFVDDIVGLVNQPAAPVHDTKCGPLHSMSLSSSSSLSERKLAQLIELSLNESFRQYLANVLERTSLLQAPMYVGKADNLQSRINQHLDPNSDLATRLREVGVVLDEGILVYAVIDEEFTFSESTLLLIEEIISRVCRPGFVLRIG